VAVVEGRRRDLRHQAQVAVGVLANQCDGPRAAAVPLAARLAGGVVRVGAMAVPWGGNLFCRSRCAWAAAVPAWAGLQIAGRASGPGQGGAVRAASLRFSAITAGVQVAAGIAKAAWLSGIQGRIARPQGGRLAAVVWKQGRRLGDAVTLAPAPGRVVKMPPALRIMAPVVAADPAPLAFVPLLRASSVGGTAEIPMPPAWWDYPLPPAGAVIGYELGILAAARGAAITFDAQKAYVGGRPLIALDGRYRTFANTTAANKWRDDGFAVLAAQLGGLAMRAGPAREAWLKAQREANAQAAQTLMIRTSMGVKEADRRDALMADAAFLLARL